MKLKKSLLALTTAATVAVAGSTAAIADDANTGANGSNTDTVTNSLGKQDGDTKTKEEKKQELAGSAQKFFGWKDNTSTLEKIASVVTLVTTVAALVGGIVSLFNNFQKLGKLAK